MLSKQNAHHLGALLDALRAAVASDIIPSSGALPGTRSGCGIHEIKRHFDSKLFFAIEFLSRPQRAFSLQGIDHASGHRPRFRALTSLRRGTSVPRSTSQL
jgi:hypothetical protein